MITAILFDEDIEPNCEIEVIEFKEELDNLFSYTTTYKVEISDG